MKLRRRRIHLLSWVFGTWFLATVAGQKLWRPEGRNPWWAMVNPVLPDWRFFAPDPGVFDHHLLIRTFATDGSAGTWREIGEVNARKLIHAVWHPEQREEKSLFDVVSELLRFIERHRKNGMSSQELSQRIQLSVAYLTLLNYATSCVEETDVKDLQFMIAISGGYEEEEPEIVFVSERHDFAR